MQSLDPRIQRLGLSDNFLTPYTVEKSDQFATYETFVQQKENKAFEHAGVIHAPDPEMAFLFAKEQYSRRFTCSGLCVVKTKDIIVTPYTENGLNIYDLVIAPETQAPSPSEKYEIFHLYKRGKQHAHAFTIDSANYEQAVVKAKGLYDHAKPVLNIWIIKQADILFSSEEYKDIWDTLSEKKHREVFSYRVQDILKKFKESKSAFND